MIQFDKVNRDTRAGRNGKEIVCPLCKETSTVYHFSWYAISCNSCNADVQKNDWLINKGEE
jgi:ribosomal protein S27E